MFACIHLVDLDNERILTGDVLVASAPWGLEIVWPGPDRSLLRGYVPQRDLPAFLRGATVTAQMDGREVDIALA